MKTLEKFYKEYCKYTQVSLKEVSKNMGQIENCLNRGFIRNNEDDILLQNDEIDKLINLIPRFIEEDIDINESHRCSCDYEKTEDEKEEDREFYRKEEEKEAIREENNRKIIEKYSPVKNIKCPRCNGTGKVNFSYANGICFKCMGTGVV